MIRKRIWPGRPQPLGASYDGEGVNFAVFSENAARVDLCLFDSPSSTRESHRLPLPQRTDLVWHGYVQGIRPGQLYGYRVHGPWDPERGHRFNAHKVLLDPYAKAVGRPPVWDDAVFGYRVGDPSADLALDARDSAPYAALGLVCEQRFNWGKTAPLRTPWHETVIYELHVRGFTKRHPGVPKRLRGTYAGLASKAAVEHLKRLGVTAVELLPGHHHLDERQLAERGLSNYWGYNTLAFFAPESRYAADPGDPVGEFQRMVRSLREAGIEVILDVVYNHTAEGSHLGPTLSFRGLDNRAYYRLRRERPRYHEDFTGCGNSLNMREPRVLQLIMDSLRYWVVEMGVDGFRFDLASTLARELYEVDTFSAFFDIIHQDPVLSRVKLIAEPWDLGEGGYQAGNFPPGWAEWNGQYRDAVRRLWKGEAQGMAELATRLSGSSDLYEQRGRRPYASVNFVTCHDGFSLQDLVSYNGKHNEANGEEGGTDNNLSWNCGAEGPTQDPAVLALRERQKRNLMATLLLSQGVPMLQGGDELGRTQEGNNNGYCQDNELSWLRWDLTGEQQAFLEFVRGLLRIRRDQPTLRRRNFFHGRPLRGVKDILWLEPSGAEMTDLSWSNPEARSLAILLAGDAIGELDDRGQAVAGDSLLILFNSRDEAVTFRLPASGRSEAWQRLFDTGASEPPARAPGPSYALGGRAVALFRAG